MKNKSTLLLLGFILQIMFIFAITNIVYSTDVLDPGNYKPDESRVSGDETVFNNKVEVVLSAIRNVGIVVSVISIIIIGIRFMIGSVEEKAEFKQVMPGYFIGTFLVFTVSVLPDLIFTLAQKW